VSGRTRACCGRRDRLVRGRGCRNEGLLRGGAPASRPAGGAAGQHSGAVLRQVGQPAGLPGSTPGRCSGKLGEDRPSRCPGWQSFRPKCPVPAGRAGSSGHLGQIFCPKCPIPRLGRRSSGHFGRKTYEINVDHARAARTPTTDPSQPTPAAPFPAGHGSPYSQPATAAPIPSPPRQPLFPARHGRPPIPTPAAAAASVHRRTGFASGEPQRRPRGSDHVQGSCHQDKVAGHRP
jgi:hypothetical protein